MISFLAQNKAKILVLNILVTFTFSHVLISCIGKKEENNHPSSYAIKRKPKNTSNTQQPKVYDPFEFIHYYEQQYDTIIVGRHHSFLKKGILEFSTQRDITFWLKSMHKQLGKPDTINEGYHWQRKNFYHHKQANIFCQIYHSLSHLDVKLIMLDRNLQLIEDSLTTQLVKDNIKSRVFNQKRLRKDNKIDSLKALGHKVYVFKYDWEYERPINFDTIMRLIAKNKKIKLKWDGAMITCLVNEKGKIDDWKLSDESMKNYEKDLLEVLKNYQTKFQFPIQYSINKPNKAIDYKTKFMIFDVLKDSINQAKEIKNMILAMNKGKYKQNLKRTSVSKDEKSSAGNTVFFNLDMNGFDTLFFDVQFCNKYYTIYLDYTKVYFFQKMGNNKWFLKQSVCVDDKYNLGIEDINKDGCRDIIVSSGPNSNGNMWSDIFTYQAEKDTFLLAESNFCCVYSSVSQDESNNKYKPNQKYYITYYGGSWYMPSYFSIYSWQEGKLQLEAEVGTELMLQDMSENDYPIFFINKNIDGEMTNIQLINLAGGKTYERKAEQARKALLDEYFKE